MTRIVALLVAASLASPLAAVPAGRFNMSWVNLGLPELETATASYSLDVVRPEIVASAPAAALHFDRIEDYRRASVRGFWAGVVGMAVSIYYVDRPAPRTAGNALWGVGWLAWLGFAAMTSAELDDLSKFLPRPSEPSPAP